jgi:hypothetical protein
MTEGEKGGVHRTSLRDMMECEVEPGYARGPERDLLLAVLFDAIQAVVHARHQAGDGDDGRRCREATEWIKSERSDYLFSFEVVCEALGMDPTYLRRGLKAPHTARLQKTRKEGTHPAVTGDSE